MYKTWTNTYSVLDQCLWHVVCLVFAPPQDDAIGIGVSWGPSLLLSSFQAKEKGEEGRVFWVRLLRSVSYL